MKEFKIEDLKCLIDLHLHIDGSLSINNIKQLASLNNIDISNKSQDDLYRLVRANENNKDLNEYLKKFDFPISLLQTKKAITLSISNLLNELKDDGLQYAELRFAPLQHLKRGLKIEEVIEAAIEGLKKVDMYSNLIVCAMRHHDIKENMNLFKITKKYIGKGVCAVDLAGAEALYPVGNFKEIFEYAKENSMPYTIHAGEADGSESVKNAVNMGATRIGHGIRSIEDESVMELIKDKNVTLEFCPKSNIDTRIFDNIKDYPLKKFIDKKIKITVNTDNMTVSNTSLKKEYTNLIKYLEIDKNDIKNLLLNSANAAFTTEDIKQILIRKIEDEFSDL